MLTDKQKEILVNLAQIKGLEYFDKNKFYTINGNFQNTDKLYKALNFPEAFKAHKEDFIYLLADFEPYKMEVRKALIEAFEVKEEIKKVITGPHGGEGMEFNERLLTLYPVIDITGKGDESIILMNPTTARPVHDLDLKLFLLRTDQTEEGILKNSEVLSVVPHFNPYSLEPFSQKLHKSLGVNLMHLNIYCPPPWRYAKAEPKFDGFIKRLIEHLFPIPEEREDVLDWLHYAITRRNGTILCLAGPRGTGKSLLMSVLSYLVGDDYSEMVNKEILEEKFNSAFKNKRLIIFEEVEVSGSVAVNRLKALANNRIVLEEKGQDSETIDNYTSMSILLNDISQLRIEAEDRRFSVPRVAEHDLKTAIEEKEIQDFSDSLAGEEIPQDVAEFGEFLLARRPTRSYMYPIRGDYYYFICSLAMPEWKNFIVQYLSDNGQEGVAIKTSTIASAFRTRYSKDEGSPGGARGLRFPDRASTLEVFLKGHKHRGEYYVGALGKELDNQNREIMTIIPNDEFLEYVMANRTVPEAAQESFEDLDAEMAATEEAFKNKNRRNEDDALGAL